MRNLIEGGLFIALTRPHETAAIGSTDVVEHGDPAGVPAAFELGRQPGTQDEASQAGAHHPGTKSKNICVVVLPGQLG